MDRSIAQVGDGSGMRRQAMACVMLVLAVYCSPRREYVLSTIGDPWRDARVFTGTGKVAARLSAKVRIATVVPLAQFPNVRPGLTITAARAALGEPSHIRRGHGKTVYVYSGQAGDVEIAERAVPPESSSPGPRPAFWYEVSIRPRVPLESEPLSRLLRRVLAAEPDVRTIIITSSQMDDPVVDLHIGDGRVVAFTVH